MLDSDGQRDSSSLDEDASSRARDSAVSMDGGVVDAQTSDAFPPEDASGRTDASGVVDASPVLDAGPPGDSAMMSDAGGPCVPQPEICNGIDDDCDGAIDNGWPTASRGSRDGSDYLICPGPVSQNDAQLACASGGGRLVIIEDGFENRFLGGELALSIGTTQFAWTDLVDRAMSPSVDGRSWGWQSTGATMSYSSWADGMGGRYPASEPDNAGGDEHCVTMRGPAGYEGSWFDESCTEMRAYVCEWSP